MMKRHLSFLLALWKANILSAMEYRASFITQVLGMMANDGVYFVFWVIFFDRFKEVRGYTLSEMFILFGVTAAAVGLSNYLFGNVMVVSDVITSSGLDYYLSLPQPVLLHLLASRSVMNGLGDIIYGTLSFSVAGQFSLDSFLRFGMGVILATVVLVSFMVLVHSLAFWMGNSQFLSAQASNAIITFSIYPITLFEGGARLLLFTLIPAAFLGAIPAEFIKSFSWTLLGQLTAAALILLALSTFVFYRGLHRYESGSAIQIQS